jgi:hypothetical protein
MNQRSLDRGRQRARRPAGFRAILRARVAHLGAPLSAFEDLRARPPRAHTGPCEANVVHLVLVRQLLSRDFAEDLGGVPPDDHPRWYTLARGHEARGAHDGVVLDDAVVENDRAHPDQDIAPDHATAQHRAVADLAKLAHHDAAPRPRKHDAAVLQACAALDHDRPLIAAI